MAARKKIEIFSAGCSTCKETIELVKRLAGSSHEVVIHDMQKAEVASKAKQHGVRSVPGVGAQDIHETPGFKPVKTRVVEIQNA